MNAGHVLLGLLKGERRERALRTPKVKHSPLSVQNACVRALLATDCSFDYGNEFSSKKLCENDTHEQPFEDIFLYI